MSREDQITLLQGMPYSLTQRGPKDIHGVGNYLLKVFSADASVILTYRLMMVLF